MVQIPQLNPERKFRLCTPGAEMTEPAFVELLIAYGQAMWSWSRVENKLFWIFAHVVEPNENEHTEALRAAFFSIISPKSRLDMIHSVMEKLWDNKDSADVWKEWSKLHTRCTKQLRMRGKLAHLVGHAMYPGGNLTKKPHTVIMEPIFHPDTPRTHADAKNRGYSPEQLQKFASEWEHLNYLLGVFVALLEHRGQQPASDELTGRLIQMLNTPAFPNPTEQPAQPKPSRRKA